MRKFGLILKVNLEMLGEDSSKNGRILKPIRVTSNNLIGKYIEQN
jgi:hypothetical protein